MSTAASPITLLALCAACFFSGAAWKTQQHNKEAQAQKQAHARALQALSSKLEQSRAKLQSILDQQTTTLQATNAKEQAQANAHHHTLDTGLRTGAIGLRVPIVPASCIAHAVPATDHPSAQPATAHAQLEPATAAALAAIPHEGDAAIRDLNTCIAQYNAVKAAHDQWRQALQKDAFHAQTP